MKIFLVLIMAVCFVPICNAQTKKRNLDVRFAAGSGTYPFLHGGGNFLKLEIFHPEFVENAYNVNLLYKINSKTKIGCALTYSNIKQYYDELISFGGSPRGPYVIGKQNILAVMPVINYSYKNGNFYQVYSEAGVGAAFETHKLYEKNAVKHSVHTAFQCTLLGVRVGKRFGGFIDLGYGYKGILQAGIYGNF